MMADADYFGNPSDALGNAMRKTNAQLHEHPVDDSLSGTTAVAALLTASIHAQGFRLGLGFHRQVLGLEHQIVLYNHIPVGCVSGSASR